MSKRFFAVCADGAIEIDGERDYLPSDIRRMLRAKGYHCDPCDGTDFWLKVYDADAVPEGLV